MKRWLDGARGIAVVVVALTRTAQPAVAQEAPPVEAEAPAATPVEAEAPAAAAVEEEAPAATPVEEEAPAATPVEEEAPAVASPATPPPVPATRSELPVTELPRLELCAPSQEGCYLDAGGGWQDADFAYAGQLSLRDPNYLRTFGEMTIFLTIGTVWYWKNKDLNVVDWDRPGWKARFTREAVRYDGNHHQMNFGWHALSGSAFYGFSRTNDLDLASSFAAAFLTSAAWEYILEFREKVSINDIIVTPGGGMAIGEFWHRLGRYVTSAPGGGGPGQKAFAWTVGLPQSFHDFLDDAPGVPETVPTDALGYDARLWHSFRSWFGYGRVAHEQGPSFDVYELAFEGELVAIPGYLRPGRFDRFFYDAELTELRLRFGMGGDGHGTDLEADTTLLGYHRQDIAEGPHGRVGNAVTVGISTAYLYRRERYADWTERQGIYDFPGAALEVHLLLGRARLRIGGRLNGDFVGLYSHAFPLWDEMNAGLPADQQLVTKTPLEDFGYYYGWGWSTRARAELVVPFAQMGGRIRYGRYNSHEGFDRYQEELTADFPLSDRMLDYDAYLRVLPLERLGRGLYLEATLRGEIRSSRADIYSVRDGIMRFQATLGYDY